MVSRSKLLAYLSELLQPQLFQDFCPNGLQVEGADEIKHLAVGVSASVETIEKAAELNVQALLVHHGIFWNKDSYPIIGTKKTKIKTLLDHNISLLAYHLPLDAHTEFGNNWRAAKDLGWKNLEPFYPMGSVALGVKGTFDPIPQAQFVKKLEKYYGHQAHIAMKGKKSISSAALISGGAHRQITDAANAGVDAFITGSFDEPVWHIAIEEGINFCALGHSATEKIGPYALGDHLQKHFKIKVTKLDEDNPF